MALVVLVVQMVLTMFLLLGGMIVLFFIVIMKVRRKKKCFYCLPINWSLSRHTAIIIGNTSNGDRGWVGEGPIHIYAVT